jgi:hypothetical protein
MAENLNLNVNVDTSEANASVGSLKKQLREAQNEVNALSDKFGATSREAVNAAKKAAELKDRIGDAKALTDAFNPDAKFKALTSSLSGVAGGFGAVQGAMALFGAESDNVQKTLLKVQSAMAISQGLQSVGESIDSFKQLGAVIQASTAFQKINNTVTAIAATVQKAFTGAVNQTSIGFQALKGAIAATGIGLLVVGLGTLISKISEWTSGTGNAEEAQKKLTEAINDQSYAYQGLSKALDVATQENILKAKIAGKSEEEITKITKEGAEARLKLKQEEFDKASELFVELANKEDVTQQEYNAAQENVLKTRSALNDEMDKQELDKLTKQANDKEKGDKDKLQRQQQTNIKNKELRAQQIEDELAEQKALEDALLQSELNAFEKRQEQRKRLALNAVGVDGLTNEEREKKTEDDAIRKDFFDKKAQDLTEKMQTDGLGKLLAIKAEGIVAEQKQDEDNLAAKRRINDLEVEAKKAQIETLKGFISNLGSAFEQGTVASKTAAIAEIGINTALGYIQGLDIAQKGAKGTGPLAPFTMPIFYASQILAVVGAVSKAKNALSGVKGGGGVGGSVSPPSLNTASPMSPAIPSAQTTNISQQSINQLGNQAVKAYVIESDVTGSQQRMEAIRQRARFS